MSEPNREILKMLASSESIRVERTVSEKDSDKFAEAICAFANDLAHTGTPGYLFIGVEDKGPVVGVKNAEKVSLLLADLKSQGNILPQPTMTVHTITVEGKMVVAAVVLPSDRPPVRYKGRTCIRVAARRGYATPEDERVLSERAVDKNKTWDMRVCADASVDDLALDLFQLVYLPAAVSRDVLAQNGREITDQLASLRFYDPRRKLPTNAAILLFGKDPLSYTPGAFVQYVRYAGNDQASDAVEESSRSGNLQLVMSWLDELAQRLAVSRPARQPNLTDKTVHEYPPIALHELLMNAVIHRNYEGSTAPISINQYADRLEILNPGSLYGELASGGFPGATSYRNPVIAEAAKTLGFVNRFGRGIAIANAELEKNGNPPAELSPKDNHFLAIVRKRP